jgi:hypothetical protein
LFGRGIATHCDSAHNAIFPRASSIPAASTSTVCSVIDGGPLGPDDSNSTTPTNRPALDSNGAFRAINAAR